MKVVIQSDSRIWGGNEKWLLLVARGLADRGHDVLMSCKRERPVAQRSRAAGLRVTHSRPGGDADLARAFGFAAMLARERPDVVLLSAFKRVFWAGWAAHRARVPRVVERMGIEQDLPQRWKYQHAFRHYVDALIVNSEVIRDRWLESAPWFPAEEVHVVLNGVPVPERRPSTLRQELQLDPGAPVVAAAGRLERRKGFDVLLEAVALAGHPTAHLVVAGEGEDAAALRADAERLGIGGRVHWLGFRDDLDTVLAGADLFVLPSRKEGMANVMLEAMAADCLVVATDVSGVREALGPCRGRPPAGWIVAPDDPAALGRALADALALDQSTTEPATEPAATALASSPDSGGPAAPDSAAAARAEAQFRVREWFAPERMIEHTEQVLAGTVRALSDPRSAADRGAGPQ